MTDSHAHTHSSSRLRIFQLNCRHSASVHHDLLNTENLPDDWDIIALQEPYMYPHSPELTIATPSWTVIYPHMPLNSPLSSSSSSSSPSIRSVLLINNKIHSKNYHQILVDSTLITAIRLTLPNRIIDLFNIYNPPDKEYAAIKHLDRHLTLHPPGDRQMIWMGDFNSHHAMWSGNDALARTSRHDASSLIHLLADHWMQLLTPRGAIKYESDSNGARTTIDLVFASSDLSEAVLSCKVADNHINVADHFAIMTVLDLSLAICDSLPCRNFRQADWDEFRAKLDTKLALNALTSHIESVSQLESACSLLTAVVQRTIEATIPITRPSPHQKRWWTKDLTKSRKLVAKLSRQAFMNPGDPDIQTAYKTARNAHNASVHRTKEQNWRAFLEDPSEEKLWAVSRLATRGLTDGGVTKIPTLVQTSANGATVSEAVDNKDKANAFYSVFFPPPPPTPLPLDDNFPEPLPFTMPTKDQLYRNIMKQSPYKAPGPDGIPNIVLQKSVDRPISPLYSIFSAIIRFSHFPQSWLEFSTVVVRKPGRGDYSKAKSFRPIALYATFYKVITSTVCETLSDLTERHNLLPSTHFGGRPGRTTSDALMLLVQRVKDAWRRKKVVTAVLLDISNAFPNAVKENMLHHLKKRRVPTVIVKFVEQILTGRRTSLRFDNYISELFEFLNGIGQGDALSTLLYLFYNADILEIPQDKCEGTGGYADDIYAYAIAPSFDEADEIMRDMFKRENGLLSWATDHNSAWEMSKSHCIRFTRRRNTDRNDFQINGLTIPCRKSAKLLGVIVDQELRWNEHAEYAASKGTKLVLAISRLTRPTFGMPHKHMRRLFTSIALPKMEYAAEVWFEPIRRVHGRKPLKGSVGHANKLSKVQNLAARLVTGAQRSTPIDLFLHANLLPTRLRMEEQVFKATVRLCTLPPSHPLSPIVRRCANRYVQSHRSPIQELFHAFDLHPDNVETRFPFRSNPPSWSPPFSIHIDSNKDDTAEFCRQRTDEIRIFSDGSGFEGGVGAASTLYYRAKSHTAHYHLGDQSENTVFESETCGVILATHQVLSLKPHNPQYLLIALDNQSVIRALAANKRQPSQYLLDEALRGIAAIRKKWPRIQIMIAWAPGHHDLPENEAVDGEAKKAAQGLNSPVLPKTLRERLPDSVAAIKANKHQSLRDTWLRDWTSSARYQKFRNVDPWTPASKINCLLSNLPRNESSLLVQLRTGHGPLNAHLSRIGSADTPLCPRCHAEPETAKHVLMHCRFYSDARRTLRTKVHYSAFSFRRLLSEPKTMTHTIQFLKSTKRFHPFF